jgi:excisionase family DNA binding protein
MGGKLTGHKAGEPGTRRRRRRSQLQVVAEQAANYGVNVPADLPSSERFLSPNEIARVLNVTGEAVKQWIHRGRLPAARLANGYWQVKVSDFENYLRMRREIGRRYVLVTSNARDGLDDIVETVTRLGHQPLVAHSYADALLKALDHMPALFVISLAAGDEEAWRFAERVRATKALRSFPILLLSDIEPSEADTDRAIKLVAQGLLTRPFTRETLSQEIERTMKRMA